MLNLGMGGLMSAADAVYTAVAVNAAAAVTEHRNTRFQSFIPTSMYGQAGRPPAFARYRLAGQNRFCRLERQRLFTP